MKPWDYLKTIMPIAVVLYLTLQRGSGYLLLLLLPIFLIGAVYSSVRMIRRPEERTRRVVRLAAWCLALNLTVGVQGYWGAAATKGAETAIQKILAYKERVGRYPASLQEIGLEGTQQKKWGLSYSLRDGKPALGYPATFMPLTMHQYDFEAHAWLVNAH